MTDDKTAIWKQLGDPVALPLIVAAPGGSIDNPALYGGPAIEPILQAQLDTQSGQHLLVPLTVEAARQLILSLAAMLQSQGFPLEPEPNEPQKRQ